MRKLIAFVLLLSSLSFAWAQQVADRQLQSGTNIGLLANTPNAANGFALYDNSGFLNITNAKIGTINNLSSIGSLSGTVTLGASLLSQTFGGPVAFAIKDSSQSLDNKMWDFETDSSQLHIRAVNDLYSASSIGMTITRSGASVTGVAFPNGTVTASTPSVGDNGTTVATTNFVYGANKVIHVIANGVKCDNSTDDTTALNAVMNSLPDNSVLEFPAGGICKFSNQIFFNGTGKNITIHGNGAKLLYTGATTNITLVTAGTSNYPSGCSILGWTIDNLIIQSNTVMTGGDGFLINDICDGDIHHIVIDGNFLGNGKLWGGLHLNGGNSVRVNGFSQFRGQAYAFAVNGDSNYQFTDIFITQSIFINSAIGIDICGRVGGFSLTQSDVLENGDNLAITQDCVAYPNLQVFIGSDTALDATNGTRHSHDIEVTDSGGTNSYLMLTGVWAVSSSSDNIKLATAGQQWRVNITGGSMGNTPAAGYYQNSTNVSTNIVGTQIWSANNYALNNGSGTLTKCGLAMWGNLPGNTFGTIGSSC